MKKILTLSMIAAFAYSGLAQLSQKRVCGTLLHEQYLNQQDPGREQRRAEFEQAIQEYLNKTLASKTSQTTIQIPLVVHMVYSSTSDSVSDAQIFSQIQILNDDYTRNNADKVNTPSTFTSVASAPMVQYCWATRDPSGNPTNGIERRKSTVTSWSTDDKVKAYATGGLDAWDPSRYFNIWVCTLQSPLLGYGEFPTSTLSNTYGFVAGATCFGNTGLAQAPYNKGRTATHEIGHCFNLIHIWGDDGGACTGTDQCNDTPNQGSENYGCPTYPHTDACSPASPGVMFMNYMDYTDDGCMNIFTVDQSARMLAVVNNPPYNALLSSNGCLPLTLPSLDAGIPGINSPVGLQCSSTVNPNVTLKNWGSATLTSVTIQYKIDGGALQNYSWSGSLASLATTTVSLPAMTTTAGTHTFSANSANPNGGTDATPSNDASAATFTVSGGAGTLPYTEGFEGATFPPAGITINNPDAATTWAKATWAAKTGVASAYMDNANYNANGQKDEMVLPAMDLTTGVSPGLTFQVAYELYTDPTASPNYSDTLAVYISTDCGASWTQLYRKYSAALSTTTPPFSTTTFTPTSTQWRQESVSLASYASSNNAIIKFVNITGYENELYIDDINISAFSGIQSSGASAGVNIYPNPSADGRFMIDIKQNQNNVNRLTVYDILGNKVYEIDQKIPSGRYDMDLSSLGSGTYFVEVLKENKPVFTKIVISK
ncbi:MAG TPA: M43 family zinc metalloprotease [Bacteroidia bacterium]|nr:M43 family zinc metalloprotease [Bacteroidia bacterium]